ncbi:unnamed protein product [Peniophora sp. CBMAI 1063]|nr:unnamed protein product [Peniophora sp. CBMAI 1063]
MLVTHLTLHNLPLTGSNLQLGDLANATYSIIPARFTAPAHNAPNVQWVVFLSGLAHFTLPVSSLPISNDTNTSYATDAWIAGGVYGTILVVDTQESSLLGHGTGYPSGEETRALQVPTAGGAVPGHAVLDVTVRFGRRALDWLV